MANTLAFIDELQGANYSNLSSLSFKVAIVDPDGSGLTSAQIGTLKTAGKSLIGYLSIGEAENFRSYWQSSWNSSPPSFLMGQDPNWPGDYNVKYWDPNWQQIVINQAVAQAKAGYAGIMLDVVDAYTVSSVAAADGGIANARADMVKFVEAISAATKAVNSNFKIIQNNALDLLTANPDDPGSATNTAYLSHIDGVVAESTFYNPDNSATSWGAWNVQYLKHAVSAGKTVLAIDYPSSASAQQSFVAQAIADGFVPFAAASDQSLGTSIPAIDAQILGQLPAAAMSSILGGSTAPTPAPTPTPTTSPTPAPTPTPTATGLHVINVANGNTTVNIGTTNADLVVGANHTGNATVNYFAHASGDVIDVSAIYGTQAQALSHVSYSSSNAIVNLGTHGTITLVGAGPNSLVAADFHVGATPAPTPAPTPTPTATGLHVINVANGNTTVNIGTTNADLVVGANHTGNATVNYFAHASGDVIDVSAIYGTQAQALSHVSYSGSNAIVNLGTHGTITLVGAGPNSLVAADFHVG